MTPELQTTLDRIIERAKLRISPRDERGSLCRCGSFYSFSKRAEVPVGWVEMSTEGRGTWRRCEMCVAKGRAPVVAEDRERVYS